MVTACLLTMNNYNELFKKQIERIEGRPSLLLHVCCGPCSMYPLKILSKTFDITIYYGNSNIFPYEEYQKRLDTLIDYLKSHDLDIKVVIPPYNDNYQYKLSEYKDSKEGMQRCAKCYALRMLEAYQYAMHNDFSFFTTVMSISNHKNAFYINHIGKLLEDRFKTVRYLYADFKKDGGIDINRQMNQEAKIYEQKYCGCVYSLKDYFQKKACA